jgi:hypothetical protein
MPEKEKVKYNYPTTLWGYVSNIICGVCLNILRKLCYDISSERCIKKNTYHRVPEDELNDYIRVIKFTWLLKHDNDVYLQKGNKYSTGKVQDKRHKRGRISKTKEINMQKEKDTSYVPTQPLKSIVGLESITGSRASEQRKESKRIESSEKDTKEK